MAIMEKKMESTTWEPPLEATRVPIAKNATFADWALEKPAYQRESSPLLHHSNHLSLVFHTPGPLIQQSSIKLQYPSREYFLTWGWGAV